MRRPLLDGLNSAGFKTWDGPNGTGFLGLLWQRGGGYYFGQPHSLPARPHLTRTRHRRQPAHHRRQNQSEKRCGHRALHALRPALRRRERAARGRRRLRDGLWRPDGAPAPDVRGRGRGPDAAGVGPG